MPARRKDDMAKTGDAAAKEARGGEILKFPRRTVSEQVGREGVLQAFRSLGFDIGPALQKFLRLPARMVRGINADVEFYDSMSVQPFPVREEDSPADCIEKGLPAPSWVRLRYVSIVKEGEKSSLIFIDAPRRIFLKEDISRQDDISSKIYDAIISPSDEAAQKG
jgi:hypothetical protein